MEEKSSLPASPPPAIESSDEISLRDILREFRLWKELARKHVWVLLLTATLGGAAGTLYAWMDTPIYVANTRFMLKNEGVGSIFGAQMSTLSGLLGGGQMGTPLERTAEVIASDRIVGRALLREMTLGDTTDLVINHFIRLSDLRKAWAEDSILHEAKFSLRETDIELLSFAQRKAYKYAKDLMVPEKGTGIVRKTFDKKSGVLTLTCAHQNEAFAIALSQIMFKELSLFFIDQTTSSSSLNAALVKNKMDSIQGELNAVRRMYAQQTDQSLGLLLQKDKIDLKSMAVKEQILSVAYAEAMKNYETYQFISQAALPSLTMIDAPYAPIKPTQKSKVLYGGILACMLMFLGLIFIRGRVFVQKLLEVQ